MIHFIIILFSCNQSISQTYDLYSKKKINFWNTHERGARLREIVPIGLSPAPSTGETPIIHNLRVDAGDL
jgi:hypothetical protein